MQFHDVHTHLVHARFADDADAAAIRAAQAGVDRVIVNGLEPRSNREVLALCAAHPNLLPALGIYPVDAMNAVIDPDRWTHDFRPPARFDVDAEIAFIDSVADQLVAVGEVGLDLHWWKEPEGLAEQERVLRALCRVAKKHDLPVILHTRSAEERTIEILLEEEVVKADFHCFGGRSQQAKRIAEHGWYLSIPPVVLRALAFQKLVRELPVTCLLTETDAPYMGPDKGERNEPANVPRAVACMAELRGMAVEAMAAQLEENFDRLFGARGRAKTKNAPVEAVAQ